MDSANFNSGGTHQNQPTHAPGQHDEQKNLTGYHEDEKKPAVRKTFMQKFKEALRDWSAKDAQDQEYDDSRV